MLKPKLRFKEFNDEWINTNIKSISVLLKDGTHGSYNDVIDGIPLLSAKDIENGKVQIPCDCRRISLKDYNNIFKSYKLELNDILLTIVGTIGRLAIINNVSDKYAFQRSVAIIRMNQENNPKFILYSLQTDKVRKQFYAKVNQSAQGGIYLDTLGKTSIIIPILSEQSKIAEFLSKVDEVIAEREEEVKDLEQQKKGLMQKIFSGQLRFTDSNNNPYPDWEEKKIGDVFEFYNGKAHEQEIDENGDYIVVNSKFISTEGQVKKYTNKAICPLIKNDIVLVMSDVPNGKAMSKCYLIEEDNKYSLNQRICCLRTKDVARFFIYQISRNKYFLKFDNGVSQTNLRKEDVLRCPVLVPCLEEQQKIANVLSKLDELIEEKKALLSDWQSFKKGLLQQMFV